MLNYIYGASDFSGIVFFAGTSACINLTDFDTLAADFDALAGVIKKGSADQKQAIIDNYLKSLSPVKNALMYPGTVSNLFDVGYFTYQLTQYASSLSSADAENAVIMNRPVFRMRIPAVTFFPDCVTLYACHVQQFLSEKKRRTTVQHSLPAMMILLRDILCRKNSQSSVLKHSRVNIYRCFLM